MSQTEGSRWNHAMCDPCWIDRNGRKEPVRTVEHRGLEVCCYCSRSTDAGIYVRDYPGQVPCNGIHAVAVT